MADYTRKGFVRGRNVRLMTVSVRPGRPNGAAPSFLSGMLREPLAGQRAVCPVPPDTAVALASPARTIDALMCAARACGAQWDARTAINLPAVMTTVREMAQALERVAGAKATALIDWQPDAQVTAIIQSWPSRFHATRDAALGLQRDASIEAVIRDYVRENPAAIRLPVNG